jgi:3-oxoacyl-[acyl-carrier protein] reductase
VAIGYRSRDEEARTLAVEIEKLGRKAHLAKGDVGKRDEVMTMHEQIAAALGAVDVMVCNAGGRKDNLFMLMTPEEWAEVFETNVMGTVWPIQAVLPGMWARRRGRIITVSSVAAHAGGRGQSNYAASKGAVEALTRQLAVELAPRGIAVNCIAPGAIDTTIWEGVAAEFDELAVKHQLVPRKGKPEEIAAWVVMLASDEGAFATGQVFHIDGGWKLGWVTPPAKR